MKLDQLNLDVTHGVCRSPVRTEPEWEWVAARDAMVIPEQLYRFYCRANYFSFDRAPQFLNDPERFLFSFLAGVIVGMRESFEEAHELLAQIGNEQGKGFSPIKKLRGEDFDRKADIRQRRAFRYLIVSLSSILDQFAETVSLLFHGDIKTLTVGRAMFSSLRQLAQSPYSPSGPVVSPKEARFEELHAVLVQELDATGNESDWFELFSLYRNKLAHLGSPMFQHMLFSDGKGEFYAFAPNRWPLFHQTMLSRAGEHEKDSGSLEEYVRENYIHQDLVEYSRSLLARVTRLINRGFEVLCTAYDDFSGFQLNERALRSLNEKKEQYGFRAFSK
ncbi:MAG: hypothetical protein AB1696_28600 [Planctomycetota bacterium]